MTQARIGALLLKKGRLTEAALSFALALQHSSASVPRLGRILSEYDLVTEVDIANALSDQAGWPLYEGKYEPDHETFTQLGSGFFRERKVFPLRNGHRRSFVFSDGMDTASTDAIQARYAGEDVGFYIGIEQDIGNAVDRLCCQKIALEPLPESPLMRDSVDGLLEEAVRRSATDIHIEPSPRAVEVRLRVDGVLQFFRSFPREELGCLVNVLFSRCEMNAGDFMRFHDGRFSCSLLGKDIDVRLSHIPSSNGSSVMLRLLERSRTAVPLEKLGYAAVHCRTMARALEKPNGLVLLTGPTGSGKTTTLYALLHRLKGIGTKVITVEDPVEIRLPLVTQIPVDIVKGHDFHQVARAILRHDPDVILIGEVRDELTAREAVRAAVTGHRVLSTLHTNDAVSAILRLRDLGIDPVHIANTLVCVVSQRLVRLLCPYCKQRSQGGAFKEDDPRAKYITSSGSDFLPVGCSRCVHGFSGRTVIAETLLVDDELRFLIEQGLVQEVALKLMQHPDFLNMKDDARRLVCEGMTSACEAVRVLG